MKPQKSSDTLTKRGKELCDIFEHIKDLRYDAYESMQRLREFMHATIEGHEFLNDFKPKIFLPNELMHVSKEMMDRIQIEVTTKELKK